MNLLFRRTLCTVILAATTSVLSAQVFVGSSSFSGGDDTGWAFTYTLGGSATGSLSFTNDRLDVGQDIGGTANRFLTWDGNPSNSALNSDGARTTASYTSSWTLDITATNTLGGLSGGNFLSIGAQARSGADYFSTFLVATSSGTTVANEYTGGVGTQVTAAASTDTDVILRIAWNADSELLSTSYSFNGGTSFELLRDNYAVTTWTGDSPTNGFNFELFMNSSLSGGLSAGTAYLDNFNVSAVPEPSAYATLAGVAILGFALCRRRPSPLRHDRSST